MQLNEVQNLTHWVIEGKCYQKEVSANLMKAVLSAPINGLAGGCVAGGFTHEIGTVSANVADFGNVILQEYTQSAIMII